MLTRRRTLTLAASALAPALLGGTAFAQAWPNRSVRLIVPYPAGGGADAIARISAQRLSEMWGQQIADREQGRRRRQYRVGSGRALGARRLHACFSAAEFLTTNPHVYPKLSYDPIADLMPVSPWCSIRP